MVAGFILSAQEQSNETLPELYSPAAIIEDQNKIYERVELDAEFPNDHRALKPWLVNQIELSRSKKKLPRGLVSVKLLIEKNGTIGEVIFIEPINKRLKKESLEIIKQMPAWRPAQQNGRPVRAYAKVEFVW
jgi:protein TonB